MLRSAMSASGLDPGRVHGEGGRMGADATRRSRPRCVGHTKEVLQAPPGNELDG